jgi:bifunctional UDP-N-acetylglucosamine pyrophosphorylase/glucosamine-1-phosphate N-acetyltransferase
MSEVAEMDRVLILYGDVPLISAETLNRLLGVAADTDLAILTADVPDPAGYGRILRDLRGRIVGIVEEKDATPEQRTVAEINTGILVADRARLDDWLARIDNNNVQNEYYLTDVTALAAAEGVTVASTRPGRLAEVAGVNDRVQLAALERDYQRHAAEDLMRSGVTLADPSRFDLRGDLQADPDVVIDINCIFEGVVRLSSGARIGPNCLLKDCSIGADTHVLANSVIDGASVGAHARIGPFARLRPETRLADNTHVGNFVEIKKTILGAGSKANHLAYLGDAEIGAGVNVGAGSITCNYDGANKSLTRIEDGAFIGSNSALVAPVCIGAGATIGAGSVIARDAPADQLTLTRVSQRTIPGWTRPRKRSAS